MENKRIYQVGTSGGLAHALNDCRGAAGGAEIILAGGDYYLDTTFTLGPEYRNLVLRGTGKVRFIGGRRMTGWKPVSDPAILSRLAPEVREHVLFCELAQNGIYEAGRFVTRGYARGMAPSHAEAFLDLKPMNLSRYPGRNEYLLITGYGKERINEYEDAVGIEEFGFKYDDERPASWAENDDLWVHGYWCWDWADSYEHVRSIDLTGKHILTHPPFKQCAAASFKRGQRFYFLNILEEVRYPGDYYIDRKENRLYFYPEAIRPDSELIVSMMETPIFELNCCDNVSFTGISFECVRGKALYAKDTNNLIIDNCLFCNIGNCAVHIDGGFKNIVKNSTIRDCGDGGIIAYGGDRRTLTPCEFLVTNNHIYNVARWSRCYNPPINARGVGITVSSNLIHDCPHSAILYGGNEISIEHNEIYSVCMETGDAGAIYSGRDLTCRGNRICHNYIHHLGGVGMGTMGIYNDDGLSGTVMEDNFFLEVGRATFMGGGIDFVVKNNVYVKCYPAITVDSRIAHTKFFWTNAYDGLKKSFYNYYYENSPYIERYPELGILDEMFRENRPLTASARISQNVFCSKIWFSYFYDKMDENKKKMYHNGKLIRPTGEELSAILDSRRDIAFEWSAGKGSWLFEKNFTAQPSDFEDAKWGKIAVNEGSEAYEYGYERREFDTIGLDKSKRNDNPPMVLTSITYPCEGEKTLTLGIRNEGSKAASGVIKLYAGKNVTLDRNEVSFDLKPAEESEVAVGTVTAGGEFTVEARSELAGVRPSRA